jgi:hypothetical protein
VLASQWAGRLTPDAEHLEKVLGSTADEAGLDADGAPDLEDLVVRTLAAIDEVLDERTL